MTTEILWYFSSIFCSPSFLFSFIFSRYQVTLKFKFQGNMEKYIYKIQIFFIWISAKKQLIMPLKQDMSPWNLIYYMPQFLMEQNKAIYHDCCFEHKVREEAMQTTPTRGWWQPSTSLRASRWHPPWILGSLSATSSQSSDPLRDIWTSWKIIVLKLEK